MTVVVVLRGGGGDGERRARSRRPRPVCAAGFSVLCVWCRRPPPPFILAPRQMIWGRGDLTPKHHRLAPLQILHVLGLGRRIGFAGGSSRMDRVRVRVQVQNQTRSLLW